MLEKLRQALYQFVRSCGAYCMLVWQSIRDFSKHGVDLKELSHQILKIGAYSLPIVLLTAVFTGMVLALQTAYGLHRFGAKNYVGNIVGLALVRELAPVLSAVMVCGRVGAGIAAEIGSMVVTEQVDAIRALGANPIRKLVTPRIIAGVITLPILVTMAALLGIYGGLLVAIYELDLTYHLYYRGLAYTLVIRDFIDAIIKGAVFGFLVVSIACYKGLGTRGGTEGVGRVTTETVVTGSIVIFVSDYFLTKFLILIG